MYDTPHTSSCKNEGILSTISSNKWYDLSSHLAQEIFIISFRKSRKSGLCRGYFYLMFPTQVVGEEDPTQNFPWRGSRNSIDELHPTSQFLVWGDFLVEKVVNLGGSEAVVFLDDVRPRSLSKSLVVHAHHGNVRNVGMRPQQVFQLRRRNLQRQMNAPWKWEMTINPNKRLFIFVVVPTWSPFTLMSSFILNKPMD